MSTETTNEQTAAQTFSGLVGHIAMLEQVWPDPTARPGLKWLQRARAKRLIPFIRMGRKISYDPAKVKEALTKNFTVEVKQ